MFTQTWPFPPPGAVVELVGAVFALVGTVVDAAVVVTAFFVLRRCALFGLGLGFAAAFASAGVGATSAASAFLCRRCFVGLAAGEADGDGSAF